MRESYRSIDLDVVSPEEVPMVLRAAADEYYEAAGELSSAWQDKNAGKIWEKIARILESAANKIDSIL